MAKYERRNFKKVKIDKPSEPKQKTGRIPMEQTAKKKSSVKSVKPRVKKSAGQKISPKQKKPGKVSATKYERKKNTGGILTVIKGKKGRNARRGLLGLCVAAVVVIGVFTFAYMTPTGISEYFVNLSALSGSGQIPQQFAGENAISVTSGGQTFCILSDTDLTQYSFSGKRLTEDQHSFANPVVKTSEARTLMYDRGGSECRVYNYKERLFKINFDDRLISANISRSGAMAFAFFSTEYASKAEVYDKNFEHVFSWNSAEETVSAVELSDNGKMLAVAAFKVDGGSLVSKVYIFDLTSAMPKYTLDTGDEVAVSLISCGKTLRAVLSKRVYSVDWKSGSSIKTDFEQGVKLYSAYGDTLAVSSVSDTDSIKGTVTLIRNGETETYEVGGIADSLSIYKNKIYLHINNMIYAYDHDWEQIGTFKTDYGVRHILGHGNSVVTVDASSFNKVSIS